MLIIEEGREGEAGQVLWGNMMEGSKGREGEGGGEV